MNIYLAALVFVAGIVLVVKGGDWFVDAASWIARAANIPTFIIGATIVSLATTLPEMIVSVMASLGGKNEMAVGNAIGSVTANTSLIMALAFVFMTVITPRKSYWKQCAILLASATILWIGARSGSVALWASVTLAGLFVLFMTLNVTEARKEPASSEKFTFTKKEIWKNIGLFVVGAAGIVLGSNLLINGGSEIATVLGVHERVIAVTMVAVGTSLPELITTITAIRKKEASLSVGNIIGANIIDISLILPICSLVSGESFVVSPQCLEIDFPVCLLVSFLALIPMLIKERASKVQGIILLLVYGAYLVLTL